MSTRRSAKFLTLAQLLLVSALLPACTADTGTPQTSSAPKPPAATAPATTAPVEPATKPIAFDTTTMTVKGQAFTVELSLNEEQNARGLMYRDFMPADHGMLFVMPFESNPGFYMKNTRIPLDIIFIDKNQKVLEIHKRKPLDDTAMGPAKPALYILELNQGVSEKIGLKPGDTIEIPKKYVKN